MEQKTYAVLTGDIVNSSILSRDQYDQLIERMKGLPQTFNEVFSHSIYANIDIVRGDSWQILAVKPSYALRFSLYLRSVCKSCFNIDSRVSIAIGTIDSLVENSLSMSSGPAFKLSGKGLDLMQGNERMSWYDAFVSDRLLSAEKLLIRQIDNRITPSSSSQARSLTGALLGDIQAKIAETTGVAQSTVSEGLAALQWFEVSLLLEHFENIGKYADN